MKIIIIKLSIHLKYKMECLNNLKMHNFYRKEETNMKIYY